MGPGRADQNGNRYRESDAKTVIALAIRDVQPNGPRLISSPTDAIALAHLTLAASSITY